MDKKANNLVLGANLLFTTVMCICELGNYAPRDKLCAKGVSDLHGVLRSGVMIGSGICSKKSLSNFKVERLWDSSFFWKLLSTDLCCHKIN